jgi:hypothetical protein
MRRSALLFGFPILLIIALLGCDSATDLAEVTVQGHWDGVGAMQQTFSGARLDLVQNADGNVTGTWRRGGSTGSVAGVNQNGNLELTLFSFETGTVVFEGRFTDRYRMEGVLNGTALDGPAVFRRVTF